jgi:ribosomal protein L11 methyltransferase
MQWTMPYRVDIARPSAFAGDRLIELGALDIEAGTKSLAALMPDAVAVDVVRAALAPAAIRVSPAIGRDDGSVWRLAPRPVRVGGFSFLPATAEAAPVSIRLVDSPAFGTGLHPTTALCLTAIKALMEDAVPTRLLDVGTGSGILALAALHLGVPHVTGLEIDPAALAVAEENARLNDVAERLTLLPGGPEAVDGMWPLVVANIRAGELMELAAVLTRRVASRGCLVLSGIPASAAGEVEERYQRQGMTSAVVTEQDGWVALAMQPSW